MDARSESQPEKNAATAERKSDRELVVTRTINGPARVVFEAASRLDQRRRHRPPRDHRGVHRARRQDAGGHERAPSFEGSLRRCPCLRQPGRRARSVRAAGGARHRSHPRGGGREQLIRVARAQGPRALPVISEHEREAATGSARSLGRSLCALPRGIRRRARRSSSRAVRGGLHRAGRPASGLSCARLAVLGIPFGGGSAWTERVAGRLRAARRARRGVARSE